MYLMTPAFRISLGGCLVRPDVLIVGEGGGVVVVPQEVREVARREQAADQEARRGISNGSITISIVP